MKLRIKLVEYTRRKYITYHHIKAQKYIWLQINKIYITFNYGKA